MNIATYYIDRYGLPALLIIGVAAAIYLVYKNWDHIVIRGSGRK